MFEITLLLSQAFENQNENLYRKKEDYFNILKSKYLIVVLFRNAIWTYARDITYILICVDCPYQFSYYKMHNNKF